MEETYNNTPKADGDNNSPDCGCTDGSCKPKKKNIFSKILFAGILLAALAIIGIKLTGRSGNTSDKQSLGAQGKAACCDTAKTKTCDTTKGSSCCSKK
jgi:hypothetical protein